MSKYPIVGICGQAGTGKDTIADILSEEFGGNKLAFAAPMKQLAGRWFPLQSVYGSSEERNAVVPVDFGNGNWSTQLSEEVHGLVYGPVPFGAQYRIDPIIRSWCERIAIQASENGGKMSARHFLQQLGTELGRAIDPDIWVKKGIACAERILQAGEPFAIITDVRFRNEALAVKRAGGVLLKITGTGVATTNDAHASEREQNSIPYFWFDHEFCNVKDGLDKLKFKVRNALHPDKLFGS